MPLQKEALAQSILSLMTQMRKETEIDDSKFANGLADAIDTFVKTGEVQPGITVSTTGTAAAQTGATTSTGKIL
mgnify:CR=1 FL=1|jgi:hypothetical protein|nr:MAG TPA: hypothetical protein [Caudoviricetes sp.]